METIELTYGYRGTRHATRERVTIKVGDKLRNHKPLKIGKGASWTRVPVGSVGTIRRIHNGVAYVAFPGVMETFATTFGGKHSNLWDIGEKG